MGHEKRKTSLLTWSDVDLTPSVRVCPSIDHGQQPMKMHNPRRNKITWHDIFVFLDPQNRPSPAPDAEKLNKQMKELGEHTIVLQEKLDESEAIRSDLHRAISIATDMATEERQKCTDLMGTKTSLEKEMLKLAKENRDLRDGLETLSRVRKRRSLSRASLTREREEDDGCESYLPRAKSRNYSESEFSDVYSPIPE